MSLQSGHMVWVKSESVWTRTYSSRGHHLPPSSRILLQPLQIGSKTPGGDWTGPILPERLRDALEMEGVLSRWAAESVAAKKAYDITTNSVTISTIHTVKGLDFVCVFLLGLDFLDPKRWSAEQIDSLVYVGITRARYRLFVPYIRENELILRLASVV